jgi:myo-inositol-1-phosphate synthase
MTVAVLIVGLRGATASTLVATAREPLATDTRFLLSESLWARPLHLPRLDELRFGGWDVVRESWPETFARHGVLPAREMADVWEAPAGLLQRDHAAASGEAEPDGVTGAALLDRLRGDIADFRAHAAASQVVLVYLATPALLPAPPQWPRDADQLRQMLDAGRFASAAPYYLAAAMLEGAAVVDYTASPTLEMPGMIDLARCCSVPVAGRDGSTGQTLLKSVLGATFAARRLAIAGWYSTNILGNHDGLVLDDPRYCEVKRRDKLDLLDPILGYSVSPHLVDIRYYPPAGDTKEAWDAIDFEGWHGCRGQLRVNWRCSDSLLAAPALIDLIRFSAHAARTGQSGVQTHLGVYFKHPLGTDERRYLELAGRLESFCRTGQAG